MNESIAPAAFQPVRLSFVPTVDDQVRAQREVWRASRGWPRIALAALPYALALMTGLVVVEKGWRGLLGAGMVLPCLLLGSLLKVPAVRRSIVRHRRQNPHTVGLQEYTFSEEGVHIDSPLGTFDMPWRSFVRVCETRETILLYVNHKAAYFVPRRALHEQDEARLHELLAARLGARAEFTTSSQR